MSEKTKERLNYATYVNSLYEQIIDRIDVGIHAIDQNGKTVIYNRKMREIESMESQDVLHKDLLDVFMFTEGQHSTLVAALQKKKETINVKQTYFNNKGTEITTINDTFPLWSDGTVQGAVEIAKDVTNLERLIRSNSRRNSNTRYTFDSIIGSSRALAEVVENSRRATRTASYVLIVGETGTGKELFAQSIHNGSSRSAAPFISQNCAALPDSLIEGLLFGTTKGAFTGAIDRPGLFEQAEGGTLLLDELNSLNMNLQAKLLRVLQEKKVTRIGGTKEIPIDVRVMATTNEDPVDAIANNHLRKDLYYRLGVVTLFIPPLRERLGDLPLLIQSFIEKYNALFQMNVKGVTQEVLDSFQGYNWPGNIRELEHLIEASMNVLIDEDWIAYDHLPYQYRNKTAVKESGSPASAIDSFMKEGLNEKTHLTDQLEAFERFYVEHYLQQNNYSISRTAEKLGLSRQSLQYRMKKLGLSKK